MATETANCSRVKRWTLPQEPAHARLRAGLQRNNHDHVAACLRAELERCQPLGDLPHDAWLRHGGDGNRIARAPGTTLNGSDCFRVRSLCAISVIMNRA